MPSFLGYVQVDVLTVLQRVVDASFMRVAVIRGRCSDSPDINIVDLYIPSLSTACGCRSSQISCNSRTDKDDERVLNLLD